MGIAVDPLTGLVLRVDTLWAEDTQILKEWIEPIAHSVGTQAVVTDDADGFKTVADEKGDREHRVNDLERAFAQLGLHELADRVSELQKRCTDYSLTPAFIVRIEVTGSATPEQVTKLNELLKEISAKLQLT